MQNNKDRGKEGRKGGEGAGCHSKQKHSFIFFKNVNIIMSANNHTKTCKHTKRKPTIRLRHFLVLDFNPLQTFGDSEELEATNEVKKKASERKRGEGGSAGVRLKDAKTLLAVEKRAAGMGVCVGGWEDR